MNLKKERKRYSHPKVHHVDHWYYYDCPRYVPVGEKQRIIPLLGGGIHLCNYHGDFKRALCRMSAISIRGGGLDIRLLDHLQKRALKMRLHITGDLPDNILLTSADVAHLGRRREAHKLIYMYKNKEKEELLDRKNVNTRSRVAPLFKTVIPSCEKYKNSALYHGAILWNMLPVNIRNIDSFDSFKAHQKKAMKENG